VVPIVSIPVPVMSSVTIGPLLVACTELTVPVTPLQLVPPAVRRENIGAHADAGTALVKKFAKVPWPLKLNCSWVLSGVTLRPPPPRKAEPPFTPSIIVAVSPPTDVVR